MSWFTEEIDRIDERWNKVLAEIGTAAHIPENVNFPYRDINFMVGKLKRLGEKSMYDNYETCKQVIEFNEHGAAGSFEKAFINCYQCADDRHKNRLALAFPDFAQALEDKRRGVGY